MSEVKEWYNSYVINQSAVGVNIRHYHLINQIIDDGLRSESSVLEVGCGIGTLTTLLAQIVRRGKILVTDISDRSILTAKENLKKFKNIDYIVTDMVDFHSDDKFDFIILPDVIEHIPIEQHNNLFGALSKLLKNDGKLIIHIPHPLSLEYVRKNMPEKLQVIDQSLFPDHIASILLNNNLLLFKFLAYSLITFEPDYIYIMAKPIYELKMSPISSNKIRILKSFERIKFFIKKIMT
ncbi:MAG: class I SAM-dependent methyltransferase [Saprospiraceae bacterium]